MTGAILVSHRYHGKQWPEAIWDEDMRLMRQANVNIVTLPVFGWVTRQAFIAPTIRAHHGRALTMHSISLERET